MDAVIFPMAAKQIEFKELESSIAGSEYPPRHSCRRKHGLSRIPRSLRNSTGSVTISSISEYAPDARVGPPVHHATAWSPFFATRESSFNEGPWGRFSPRSHWLTSPVVTLR